MVPPLEEREDGNRASFSRWEKRSVISNHLPELVFFMRCEGIENRSTFIYHLE